MSEEPLLLLLPKENLPDCWADETRINVLFAPFRNKSVNPKGWDSKLSFWKNLICECCIYNKVYAFKAEDMHKVFNRNGRSPSCLNTVIDEMHKSGDIKPLDQFLKKPIKTWGAWVADLVIKRPILWSYSKIKESLLSSPEEVYVCLPAIEKNAEKFLLTMPEEFKNKVISLQELIELTGINICKLDGVKLILHYLMCLEKLDIREISTICLQESFSQNLLIKIGDTKKLKPISDLDVSMHILKQNEKTLNKSLEKLENEVTKYVNEAKGYLKKGHRQMAKNSLRKKHEVEKQINKNANALQNIQVLLAKLQDSSTDSQILDSYKLALSTLKKSFEETGLSEDSVADTITELGDILDMHEDIQNMLSQPITGNDNDLEDELSELLIESNLPTPPKPPSPTNKIDENIDVEDFEKRLEKLRLPTVDSNNASPITAEMSI